MPKISPVPLRFPLISPVKELLSRGREALATTFWARWLNDVRDGVNAAAQKIGEVLAEAQAAAIATTAVNTQTLDKSLYRVTWYARIVQAATTSSSLTLTLRWTDKTVACSHQAAAITGNTTATVQSGTILVRADTDTTLRYETAYASVGAQAMTYDLLIVVETQPGKVDTI